MRWPPRFPLLWSCVLGALGLALGVSLVPGMILEDSITIIILGLILYCAFPSGDSVMPAGFFLSLSLFGLWAVGLAVTAWACFLAAGLMVLTRGTWYSLSDGGRAVVSLGLAHWALVMAPGETGVLVLSAILYIGAFLFLDPWSVSAPRDLLPGILFHTTLSGAAYLTWRMAGQLAGVSVFAVALCIAFAWDRHRSGRLASMYDLLLENRYKPDHSQRVADSASAIGWQMGLDFAEIQALRAAAVFHDTGYTCAEWRVQEKTRPLTLREAAMIRAHPSRGAKKIKTAGCPHAVVDSVLYHHERYDGTGYPMGLKGKNIPVGARILAVADAFDALTSTRSYRAALDVQAALEEIRRGSGSQFDPDYVEALVRCYQRSGSLSGALGPDGVRDAMAVSSEFSFSLSSLPRWRSLVWGASKETSVVLALWEFGREVCALIDVDEICRLVGSSVSGVLPGARCALLLAEPRGFRVHSEGLHGDSALGDGPPARALREKRPIVVKAAAKEWAQRPDFLADFESGVLVPMILGEKPLGVLVTYNHRRFTPFEVSFISGLASFTTLAIGNALLHNDMQERLSETGEMKRFTESVVEAVNSGIIVMDRDGWISLMNKKAKELLAAVGLDAARVAASKVDMGESPLGLLALALETGQESSLCRDVFAGPAGDVIMSGYATPLCDERGEISGVVGVFYDVTREVLLERQMRVTEQMASLGEMASDAAHELRNPLTALKGFIQLLSHRMNDHQKGRYLEIISGEIDRMNRIIEEFLLMAKPHPKLDQQVCLNEVVMDVVEAWRRIAVERDVEIRLDLEDALPRVKGESSQLKQVLFNLMVNALDAMPNGGSLVLATSARQKWLEVSVEDSGWGMTSSQMEELFRPFFTTKEKGTGLGLAVSYDIVRNHGGVIDVESTPGKGSRFTVYLPVGDAEEREVVI